MALLRLHTVLLGLLILLTYASLTLYHFSAHPHHIPALPLFIRTYFNLPLPSPPPILNHEKRPFYLHEMLLVEMLLRIALMIPTQSKVVAAIFIPVIGSVHWRMIQSGSKNPATGYAVGTFVCFNMYQTLDLLVFSDFRRRFRRVPFGPREKKGDVAEVKDTNKDMYAQEKKEMTPKKDTKDSTEQNEQFVEYSEPYPRDLLARYLWILELANSFRFPGWNRQILLPPQTPRTPSKHLFYLFRRLILIYLWTDLVCYYVRVVDRPYFVPAHHALSSTPASPPHPNLSSIFSPSTLPPANIPPLGFPPLPEEGWQRTLYLAALQVFRSCISASVMYAAIDGMYTVISFFPILLGYLLSVRTPTNSSSTWEIWKYRYLSSQAWPDLFGSWTAGNWFSGVANFWGRAWHGLFKRTFTNPPSYIIRKFGIERNSFTAQMLYLWIPFIMSGVLHFAGNWTQSSSGVGSLRFFLLQPLGVMFEAQLAKVHLKYWGRYGTGAVEKVVKFLWTLGWFVVTSQSFLEDYRYGGLWLAEPVPISLWRGLLTGEWWVWGAKDGREWWSWGEGWKIVL